jgi:pSer/pThr/pTyr-binding forkhead associated (FHA) protein
MNPSQGQESGMAEIEPTTPESSGNLTPPDAERWQTAPLAEGETEVESPSPKAPATLLRLRIAQSGRTIEARTSQVCEIGRPDPGLGLFPDLDLSQEGPEAIWVSRRHACIFYHDGHFYIEDLGSTNGTYLNNKRLVSGLPYALQDGDELRFGRIVAHVHIE